MKCQQSLGWLIISSHLNGWNTSPLYPDYGSLSSINPRLEFWHRKCKVRANWSIGILIDSCHTIFYAFTFFLAWKYFYKIKAETLCFLSLPLRLSFLLGQNQWWIQDFLDRGRQSLSEVFCQNQHENERNWTKGDPQRGPKRGPRKYQECAGAKMRKIEIPQLLIAVQRKR